MIVNYDKNDGWSTLFDNVFQKSSLITDEFKKAATSIQSISEEIYPPKWTKWADSIEYSDKQLLTFLGDVYNGKRKITDLGSYMDELQQPMSRFESFTKSVGNTLKKIGSMAVNMVAAWAISEAISLAIQGIDYLIHMDEIAIEKGEEAQNTITEAYEEFEKKSKSVSDLGKKYASNTEEIETTSDAIDALAERYAKLKDGVNSIDNSNLSLSSDEYQEYLDISNQLAESFPSLKSGADSAGNSILNLGTNVATSADKMKELYETEMAIAHTDILENADDSFKGYYTQVKELQKEIDSLEKTNHRVNESTYSLSEESIKDSLKSGLFSFANIPKDVADEIEESLKQYGEVFRNRTWSDTDTYLSAKYKIEPIVDEEELQNATNEILSKVSSTESYTELGENKALIAAKKAEQKQVWTTFAEETVKPFLATTTTLMDVPSELTDAVQNNLENIDWSKMYTEYDGDVNDMLLQEFVLPLKNLKPDAQEAIIDAFSLDPSQMSISEYEDAVSKALDKVSDDDNVKKDWKERFGFDTLVSDAKKQADALKNEFKDVDASIIDSLSGEDRELAYTVVIEDEDFNGTWEDVKSKVEELKELGKDAVTFSYSGFITDVGDAVAKMDAINAALASSVSGKGVGFSYEVDEETGAATLTGELADLMDAYSDLDGYDIDTLFTRTANGIQLNRKALRALQAEEEAENKTKWGEQRKALIQDIADATNNLKEVQKSGDESAIASAQANVDSLNNQLQTVNLLAAAYDGATSAYQKWLDAQSNGETGDMYRTASSTMKERGQELWEEGRYNTEEFRAIAQYFSNEDLSLASMEQVVQAYQRSAAARERYFTGDKVGIDNFMYDLYNSTELAAKGVVTELEDGRKQFNAGSDQILADYFGLNVESIQALLNAAAEYTDSIVVGDTSDSQADLQALQEAAEKANSELKKLQEEGSITADINFDVDVSELDEAGIDERISQLETLKQEAEVKFGADSSEVEYIDALLAQANARKEKLTESEAVEISVDINGQEDIDSLGEQLSSIPEDSSANVTVTISNGGQLENTVSQLDKVPENTSANFVFNVENQDQADALAAKVDELNASRGEENQITYSFNVVQNDETPSLKTTSTATVNYGLGTQESPKDKDAKVNYKLGDQKEPKSPKVATVNYALGSVAKPKDVTVKVNYELGGVAKPSGASSATGTMLSPAHASGTAYNVLNLTPAHAKGKVSLSKDENALVNEMGTESLIRDGVWSLIPGGMHVQALKKGDIILSASQTKSLLSFGKAAGTGKAYASGTIVGARGIASAYSSGTPWVFGNTGSGNLQGTGYSPSSSSTSSNTNTSSTNTASEEAEEFKEDLDWIERKLKEVERQIENLDQTVSATYKSWSERNAALSNEISKVNEEISIQQQAYERYMQQANSVGLSDAYKQLVQAGKIDIETITDEDLKEQIDDYQNW